MKYKIYEVETKDLSNGNQLKKLVMQGEHSQYPDKNVTMWNDHPLFDSIAPGQEHELEIKVEDSTTPNPHGGYYKNKTVLKPGQPNVPQMRKDTNIEQRLDAINAKVDKILDKLPKTEVEKAQEITPEDSPF